MNKLVLRLLSGGAAAGLLRQLQPAFEAAHGCRIEGTFGAVGAMKDKLLAGEPCDLLILSDALIRDLVAQGHAVPASVRAVGNVLTGLARKDGAPVPPMRTEADLQAFLGGSGGIYFPDPAKATAGIHFMKVLRALGLAESHADRLHTYPNGAAAMAALAASRAPHAVGCTQVTEILITPGVQLVGLLPPPHELSTTYTAAVCTQAAQGALARELVEALAGAAATAARQQAGFV